MFGLRSQAQLASLREPHSPDHPVRGRCQFEVADDRTPMALPPQMSDRSRRSAGTSSTCSRAALITVKLDFLGPMSA